MMKKRLLVGMILVAATMVNSVFAAQLEFLTTSRGPVMVYLPDNYDPATPLPLVMGLHGFRQNANELEDYWDFHLQVDSLQFIYVVPDGDTNFLGQPFWNATDACCDLFGNDPDDSSYLRKILEQALVEYSVDESRIHIAGFSNGGFMAHRMAIDHADLIASIASQAGANFHDAEDYQPTHPVHVLQVHGTTDATILYGGGSILGAQYPGAVQTQTNWTMYNQMDADTVDVGDPFNLDFNVSGDETTIQIFDPDNELGIAVELWTMTGSGHGPDFGDGVGNRFADHVLIWLLAHTKVVVPDVVPSQVLVEQGINSSGSLEDLYVSDDLDFTVRRDVSDLQSRTGVVAVGESQVLVPSSMVVTYEGSVFARSTVTQSLELFDFVAGDWVLVDQRNASRFSDSTVEVDVAGDLARFVDQATLEVRMRIRHSSAQNRAQLTVNMDQLRWAIAF